MNILPREKQIAAIAALCEGVSIRATERLTGVNRGTVMDLGARVGMGCAKLHNALMRDLNVSRIEFDEIWQYVAKKRKAVKATDPETVGDQYTFIALGGASKAIISYYTGTALDGLLPPGTATEDPMNLDRNDTVQSVRQSGEFRGRFTVINGGKKD